MNFDFKFKWCYTYSNMDDLSVFKAFENDFDSIILVDLISDTLAVQHNSSKSEKWIHNFEGDSFGNYVQFITNTFIFPEDREWFKANLTPEAIQKHLLDRNVFLFNHRVFNVHGKAIFYQTKIARIDDSLPITKFVIGGHSIDDVERSSLTYQAEYVSSRHNAVIESLATDYDLICYVKDSSNDVTVFHSTDIYKNIVDDGLKEMPDQLKTGYDKLKYFFNKIIYAPDVEKFRRDSAPEVVTQELEIYPSYELHFRALIQDQIYYYKMKLIPDVNNPGGFVLCLLSFDEQVRTQIQRREQEKARDIMEKQLEIMIVERTSEIQSKNKVLNRINEDIIEMLGDITEARDIESGEHIRRVKGFTHTLAMQVKKDWPEYKLTKDKVDLIASASALHDIGKIMIPDAILLKPGRLTPEEFETMKQHSVHGCELLQKAPKDWSSTYLATSMEICRSHHEKYDGKGYPEGLAGDDIPISAQIVAVADCYDALTAKRVYKEALSADVAFQMILEGKCGTFNPKLMESFLKCKEKFTDPNLLKRLPYYSILPVADAEKLSRLRVLFVEDSEMSRMIGREMLEGEGATVVEAENGKIALELYEAMVPGTFDAIVMDVNMPVMDGPEATRRIRALERPDAATIPIIALTASEEVDDLQRCLSAGMNCYLTKPVKISELTDILLKLNKKK